jgi:hypothetical protein
MLDEATDDERVRLERLSNRINFKNAQNFPLTYDRHKSLYGPREKDFPDKVYMHTAIDDIKNDPDWSVKVAPQLFNVKGLILWVSAILTFVYLRERRVNEYDRLKRIEQRAMQNKEADEVYNKKMRVLLFDSKGEQWSEQDILEANALDKNQYFVLWHDVKLKNYELFLEYLTKKHIAQAEIKPILVVDKQAIMDRVEELWRGETALAQKANKTVLESAQQKA